MFASVASGALAGGKVAQGWGEQGMASAVWVEAVGFEVCGREGGVVCGCCVSLREKDEACGTWAVMMRTV
ncbi:hypothetical protein [Bartonella krasnovii]|uniref:Uncharacterized protein n=1 Tax=Bartonella krasnovii TaxID=2267275 RepID=A0A5B9D2D7_9HYPH|nr:hypothetical protein [Bartonella krasnovii]QEE12723.1 hypothetical protein D1092_07140 [Bartonella krasnovii]UNF28832.1 hypothetical protein MNL13_06400 [Bartonella krasnovii]UNF35204.1 hypothetical protein MNL12_06385 [Bartonella krasnovii]UNF36830.1 hypothetical protein MNL11_07055 [Bartonella krasnovii]UNF38519.1 hypothetical protein MNL10_07255 [Bartonella krasnovii]